ncbi:MAG: leucine-rich repeat domain-containing protein [Clostridia bacterium]|nr:leucine-rich repeat domain-containing protein [Clostridia bacterium]
MKRKILILMALVVAIVCMLAISVSAAEPNNEGKTVTLADGTVCALYDTDGNPLIWYITSTDADTGAKTYAYIAANDSAVEYYNGWNGGDQLNYIKITVADTTYEKGTFVVLNLYGAKITSGQRIGNEITYFSKTFTDAQNLEYAFLPLGTTGLGSEDFKNCPNLQFVNIEELTELTRIGSQSFNGCPKLFAGKKVDLSNTKLVSTDTNALATVAATEYIFPTTFTTIGQETFKENKYVTKITFLGEVTTIVNGAYATFKYCENLETVTGTAKAFESGNLTSIGNDAFRGCKKLKQFDGFIENGILTIPASVTSIGQYAFENCDLIKAIKSEASSLKIYQQSFHSLDNLEFISFPRSSKLELPSCEVFSNNANLKAVAFPDDCTLIPDRGFKNCTALTAVYLPANLYELKTNGGAQGPFANDPNLYFVQDWFDVLDENGEFLFDEFVQPERPDVYYFPDTLTVLYEKTFGTGFHGNYAINPVLVFGTNVTRCIVPDGLLYECGNQGELKTAVFLGDMTQLNFSCRDNRVKNTRYIFANANDKSIADVNIIDNSDRSFSKAGNEYFYFCNGGIKYQLQSYREAYNAVNGSYVNGGTYTAELLPSITMTTADHVVSPKLTKTTFEATCIKNAIETQYCFCSVKVYEGEVANTATGIHIYDDDHDCTTSDKCTADPDCTEVTVILSHELYETLVYESFLVGGKYNYGCSNDGCTAIDIVDEAAKAIFSAGADKGYSTNGDGIAFGGYTINIDALNEYNRVNENSKLNFGIIIVNPNYVGDTFMKDGKANAEKGFLQVDMSDAEYSNIQIMVNGFTGNAANLSLVFTLYAYTDVNDVEFIQSEDTLSASAKVTKTDATLYTVTLDSVKAQAGTAIPELPEYVVPSKEQE